MDKFKNILSWSGKNGGLNYFFIKKIEKLCFIGNIDSFTTDLTLHLVKEISDNDLITVIFKNVTIVKFDISLTQLAGLAIEDISNRELENCNYRIYSYESDNIDFNCEEIKIINNAT